MTINQGCQFHQPHLNEQQLGGELRFSSIDLNQRQRIARASPIRVQFVTVPHRFFNKNHLSRSSCPVRVTYYDNSLGTMWMYIDICPVWLRSESRVQIERQTRSHPALSRKISIYPKKNIINISFINFFMQLLLRCLSNPIDLLTILSLSSHTFTPFVWA